MKKLVIILPCYNEEEILELTHQKISNFLEELIQQHKISSDSKLCYIDDGSKDKTWKIIKSLKNVIGVKLSRNFGHQKAIVSALESLHNKFDLYVTIDADLQDDFRTISDMIDKNQEGAAIVYGVRKERKTDTFFKRKTAEFFYKIMSWLGVETIYNHADFRLIDDTVLKHFLEFKETHLFLRSIFPLVGFKTDTVYYSRNEREAGESKYPLKKMISFAWEGITSFSVTPLRLILTTGIMTLIISLFIACWVIFVKISGRDVKGWTSLTLIILFFSSLQMIFLGIIGEYLGKIYQELKRRPRYIVEEIINNG